MKTNVTKFLFSALFVMSIIALAPQQAKAQEWSGGLELGLPTGSFSDGAGLGFGVSGRYEKPFGSKTSWLVDAGLSYFGGKSVAGISLPNWTMIPIQGGVKYYFDEQMKGFYASGQLGFHHLTTSSVTYNGVTIPSLSETDFSFAPGIGYHLDKFDIGLRYQVISASGSSASYFGVRAAYIFPGK